MYFTDEREAVQKKTFTKWVNSHLGRVTCRIGDLYTDLRDGRMLIRLLEVLSGEQLVSVSQKTSSSVRVTAPLRTLHSKEEGLTMCLISPPVHTHAQKICTCVEFQRDVVKVRTVFFFFSTQPKPTKGRMRIHCLENVDKALQFLKEQKVHLENMGSHDIVDGNHRLTLGLIWTIILRFQVTQLISFSRLSQLSFCSNPSQIGRFPKGPQVSACCRVHPQATLTEVNAAGISFIWHYF